MTEMVHGVIPTKVGDPVLPRWWRTVDKWTLSCILGLFAIGLLLLLAASPPLASKNGKEPFYYVMRQAQFGALGLLTLFIVSTLPPQTVRRLASISNTRPNGASTRTQ